MTTAVRAQLRADLTATRTGNYYISAGAYVDRSEGGYTVTLTDLGPSDDFAETPPRAG
jgi:hypothetical protein